MGKPTRSLLPIFGLVNVPEHARLTYQRYLYTRPSILPALGNYVISC